MGIYDDITCLLTIDDWQSMWIAPSTDQVLIAYREAKRILQNTEGLQDIVTFREHPHPQISIGNRAILFRTAGEDGRYIRGYGKGLKRIRVDEAAYIKKEVIDGVIEPVRLDMRAELILQGTPFGKNWFYDRFEQAKGKENVSRFQFPTTANPFIDKQQFEESMNMLGPDSIHFKTEYMAEFVDTQGSVFPWELIQKCLYDNIREDFNNYVCGIDIARYSDYTAVVVAGVERGLAVVVDVDRFTGLDWTAQKARVYDIVHKYKARGAADATGPGDQFVDDLIRGEYVEDTEGGGMVKSRPGLALEKVRITSNAIKRELIDKLVVKMHQGLVKLPQPYDDNTRTLIDELKYFRYELTQHGNVKMEAASGRHDDCVMALALAIRTVYGTFEKVKHKEHYDPNTWGYWIEAWSKQPKEDIVVRPTL